MFLPWGSCEKVSTFLSVESSVEFYEGCDVKDLGLDVMIKIFIIFTVIYGILFPD